MNPIDFQNLPESLHKKFQEQDPYKWIQTLRQTNIKNVYENIPFKKDNSKPLIIVVIGPSGSGKDTSVNQMLEDRFAVQAITATSRQRRVDENEPEWKYTWMPERNNNESDEAYEKRLTEQYDLIEHDFHDGNVYGLPRKNLEEASKSGKPIIIRTENKGLSTIRNNLKNEYNIVSVLLTAESYKVLFDRISGRNNTLERMLKAPDEIAEAKKQVNYVLLNPQNSIEQTQDSMKALVNTLLS